MIINPTVLKARKAVGISKRDLLAVAGLKRCASAVPGKRAQGITVTTQIRVLPSWTHQTSTDLCAHPQSQLQDVLPTSPLCCAWHFPFWVAISILFLLGWECWNRVPSSDLFVKSLPIGLAISRVVSQGVKNAFITWFPSTLKLLLPCHTQTQSCLLEAEDCFYELMQPWATLFLVVHMAMLHFRRGTWVFI